MGSVQDDKNAFEQVGHLFWQVQRSTSDELEISLARVRWFNASMSPALWVALKGLQLTRKVHLDTKRTPGVDRILTINGFLPSLLGSPQAYDTYGTTVPFRVFNSSEAENFEGYVGTKVTHHRSFPTASESLRRQVTKNLVEVFINTSLHANTNDVIACGQFFPNKNFLDFCVADGGVGICENVRQIVPDISDEDALLWAMQEGHTTKPRAQGIPGGLGLKRLMNFIGLNGGRIMIVSGYGYYEYSSDGEKVQRMQYPFPGTATYLQVCTDDVVRYYLAGEVPSEDDIF